MGRRKNRRMGAKNQGMVELRMEGRRYEWKELKEGGKDQGSILRRYERRIEGKKKGGMVQGVKMQRCGIRGRNRWMRGNVEMTILLAQTAP